MGNVSGSVAAAVDSQLVSSVPPDIPAPDDFTPCKLKAAEVVFAPIGRLGAGAEITKLALDAENRIVAVGTGSGLVMLVGDKHVQMTLRPPDQRPVKFLSFLSDHRLFCSDGRTIELWNWSTGNRMTMIDATVSSSSIFAKRFVVFGTDRGQVEIFDADHCRLSAYVVKPSSGRREPASSRRSSIPSNESAFDKTIASSRRRLSCNDAIESGDYIADNIIDIAVDDTDIFIGYSNRNVRIYNFRSQRDKQWLQNPDDIAMIAVEPKGATWKRSMVRFACGGDAGRISIWNEESMEEEDSVSPFRFLIPNRSSADPEPIIQIEWVVPQQLVVLSGVISQLITIFSADDYSTLSSIPCDMSSLVVVPGIVPAVLICSSSHGEMYISQVDSSYPRETLIPSDFAQAVLYKTLSHGRALSHWILSLGAASLSDGDHIPAPPADKPYSLQGGISSSSTLSTSLLVTSSSRCILSFWNLMSPFSATFLSKLDMIAVLKEAGDDFLDITAIDICADDDEGGPRVAIGFSSGIVAIISYDFADSKFIIKSISHVHSRPITLIQICSQFNRIATSDQFSVSLCELGSGELLFATQLQYSSSILFTQIENLVGESSDPLLKVLLVGTKHRTVFGFDATTGQSVNPEFHHLLDVSVADTAFKKGISATLGDDAGEGQEDVLPKGNRRRLPASDVLIAGVVDLEGQPLPLQSVSDKKSVYISPRYLIGSWCSCLRICEIIHNSTQSTLMELKSMCEIRYPYRILRCWIISQPTHDDEERSSSAVVTIDQGRRIQIRRLMDLGTVLLQSDIPDDLRTEEIPRCSCTADGRLSWKSTGGEMVTAILFMDGLRRVQAPMISATEGDTSPNRSKRGSALFSTITKAIRGESVVDMFSEERSPAVDDHPEESRIQVDSGPMRSSPGNGVPDRPPLSAMTSRARRNLEKVRETADNSERLNTAASDFMMNAKRLAEKQNRGWF